MNETEQISRKSSIALFGTILLICVIAVTHNRDHNQVDDLASIMETEEETINTVDYEFYENASEMIEPEEVAMKDPSPEEDVIIVALDDDPLVKAMEKNITEPVEPLIAEDERIEEAVLFDETIVEEKDSPEITETITETDMAANADMCQMQHLGLQFECNPNWRTITSEKGAERFVVTEEPLITFSINELEKPYRFLGQLNTITLSQMGLYQDGFKIEKVQFAGHNALLVKALAHADSSTQQRDYFYIHNGTTVRISFMLPDTEWSAEDRIKLQEITKSFQSYSPELIVSDVTK